MTYASDPMPQLSPHGQGNAMLFTPASMLDVDEGFEDFIPNNCQSGDDWQLFPSSTGGTVASAAPSGLFGEIPSTNINLAGVSARELLEFYNQATANAVANHHHHHNNNSGMEWISDDQYNDYRSH
jgi:hypothetical protein